MFSLKRILKQEHAPLFLLLCSWGAYLVLLFARIIGFKDDGLYVGHENVWSDWALHIGMANIFALKEPSQWFAYHPMYAGGKFTYPFVTNLIPGLLMRLGLDLPSAMKLSSILYAIGCLCGFYFLCRRLLNSGWQAFLAISIFLLSSGLGFFDFVRHASQSFSWDLIAYPPKDYTRIEGYSWLAGNVLVAILVPQRAGLLGMTVSSWALFLFLRGFDLLKARPRSAKRRFLSSAILLGALPVIHVHSLIAIAPGLVLACLGNLRFWRAWLWCAVPAGALALMLYLKFISGGIANSNFMKIFWGWTVKGGFLDWMAMWLRIWGLMAPVALVGLVFYFKNQPSRHSRLLILGLFLTFALANIILFQPTDWDNSKLFFWSYFGFSVVAASMLARGFSHPHWGLKSSSVIVLLCLTLTGVLEVYRLARVERHTFRLSDDADIRLSKEIREKTRPTDVFLTATIHNHPIMMWAVRPVLMGYPGWVNNYGFDYQQRAREIESIFRGAPDTERLLSLHQIKYVAIGPSELREFRADEAYFRCRYGLAFQNANFRIYEIGQKLDPSVCSQAAQ
ncbi:MAG: hypothetical protein AB1540_00685 [Bdellovibrionota bacterium]